MPVETEGLPAAISTPAGERFEGRPDPEMFENLEPDLPEKWLGLIVWANTRDADSVHSEGALACQQHFFGGQKMACAYNLGIGLVRSGSGAVVEYVRPLGYEAKSRTRDGKSWTSATKESRARCARYVACVAEHEWLGRPAPWNNELPDDVFGRVRGVVLSRGNPSFLTEKAVKREYERRVRLLAHRSIPEGELGRVAKLPPSDYRSADLKKTAVVALWSKWLVALSPWTDWPTFVRSRLAPRHLVPITVE